uniref:type II secretion system F family protein n=1 Tax=Marinobacterium profundum TaxID=1714300 RepID=UPI00082BD491|nr:type II secretion system F family protein [Marinobacterium profundum]
MIELVLLGLLLVIMLCCGIWLVVQRRKALEDDMPALPETTEVPPERLGLAGQLRILRLNIEPLVFVAGIGMLSVLVFLLFLELFPESVGFATMAAVCVMPLAFFILKDLAAWRARVFEARLTDALDLIQAALLGGEPPRRALLVAAEATKGAVKEELQELMRRLDYGLPIDNACARMIKLYDTEGVRLFTQVLIAQWQSDASFGALITAVSSILRERIKRRLLISGQLSGTRFAAIFAAILPYLLIPVFLWKEPQWLERLTDHPAGPNLLFAAVMCQVVGFLWLRKLLRSDQ